MAQKIKKYILSQVANKNITLDQAKELILELADLNENIEVAVIGFAGRFPKAADIEEFWRVLCDGENCIDGIPDERKRDIYNIFRNKVFTEFIYGRSFGENEIPSIFAKGGYLKEIDKFDSSYFRIPPNEAIHMDPLHRILLEIAAETLEEAGYGGDSLYGSKTGVYIGKEGTNYSFYKYTTKPNQMQLTGSWESLMASRISYLYDFKSPCMILDTACSAGLVSIHTAIRALQNGECEQALAGGINISYTGELKASQTVMNMGTVENEDGYVKTFDKDSKGTVWGEGVGMVLLKPLEKAVRDGDHIHAVIKGSWINNDGHSNSLTAPNAETQKEVVLGAWKEAGIEPGTISYIETHGTGTLLGDPIEVEALNKAMSTFTAQKQFCGIGSLKTNMGHLVGASGVASLIKVILSLENKKIPPIINFKVPNPYIDFMNGPFYINDKLADWDETDVPRRAAISSFGFSRTNCHMVVEEAPPQSAQEAQQPRYCLTISAKNREILRAYLEKYTVYLMEKEWNLGDLCYTSNIGRGHYECRVVITAASKTELKNRLLLALNNMDSGKEETGICQGQFKIINSKKKTSESDEITKIELQKLSKQAAEKINKYIQTEARDEELLSEICRLYIKGAEVNWIDLYRGEPRTRISIPVYPFERKRYWAELKETNISLPAERVYHPLVEYKRVSTADKIVFETVFGADKQWALTDHHINHVPVLPGTSYLEMMRYVMHEERKWQSIEFRNIVFLSPLTVIDEVKAKIEVMAMKKAAGYSFQVVSNNDNGNEVVHVKGEVYQAEQESATTLVDINGWIAGAQEHIEFNLEEETTDHFYFGPHWDSIRNAWIKDDEALIELELAEKFLDELAVCQLHPALLDNAVNFMSQVDGKLFLPFMYKKLTCANPLTWKIYSHIVPVRGKNGETMSFNIKIMNEQGSILVSAEDYCVKEVKDFTMRKDKSALQNYIRLTWERKNTGEQSAQMIPNKNMKWAVITLKSDNSLHLMQALRTAGLDAVAYELSDQRVSREPDYDDILNQIKQDNCTGLVFAADYVMSSLDTSSNIMEEAYFNIQRSVSVDAVFYMTRTLLQKKMKTIEQIKVLVKNAHYVDGSEQEFFPLAAATVSLGKVIKQEYRNFEVDILDASPTMDVRTVVSELFNGTGFRALRESGVYTQLLTQDQMELSLDCTSNSSGTHVITGGLGRIGLYMAQQLAKKGCRDIILCGRNNIEPQDNWQLLADKEDDKENGRYSILLKLKQSLNSLKYIAIDVSKAADIAKLTGYLDEHKMSLGCLYHAAGVIGNGFLMLKSNEKYHEVVDPKLNGTFNLYKLVKANEGSHLFLFSSITALTGGLGQSDYCAANSFLDCMCEYGKLHGIPVSAVNWPIWGLKGMEEVVGFDDSMFKTINPKAALQWMDYCIDHPLRMIVPVELNQKMLLEEVKQGWLPFRVDDICYAVKDSAVLSDEAGHGMSVSIKVRGVVDPNKVQRNLANIVGNLLGIEEIDIYDTFTDLGGNSLMSTQYLSDIEKIYPGKVTISDIYSYATISELAEYIGDDCDIEEIPIEDNAENVNKADHLVEFFREGLEGTEMLDEFMAELNR